MGVLLQRSFSTVVLLGLLAGALWWDCELGYYGLVCIFCILAAWEWRHMLLRSGKASQPNLSFLFGVAYPVLLSWSCCITKFRESALAEHSASYPTAQLSGGEKFLISLVLGVALSTVVQSRFGGISIDAMFIDEGFGSLDPAALADAVKVIYTIQGSRRKVGIISHVDKLKEEIPCCINVKKDRHGSSLSY